MNEGVGGCGVRDSKIGCNLCTEVVGVGADSVYAVVASRHHDGEHFPLTAAQGGRAVHERPVEFH